MGQSCSRMERGVVEKAGDLDECALSSAVTPKILTALPSHSSGSGAGSLVVYSTRIQGLTELRIKTDNQLEFDIESSRSHWTEVPAASDDSDDEQVSNRVAFKSLKKDPHWGPLFCRPRYDELEIGAKIAEGGQAEIFEAFGRAIFDAENTKRRLVLKVFKEGFSLVDLQRMWPRGIRASATVPPHIFFKYFDLSNYSNYSKLCWPVGVHLLDDERFAFIYLRATSDLRKLIDQLMLGSNCCPPFSSHIRMHSLIKEIAEGMHILHEVGILHNDLKAANVLVLDQYGVQQAFVADFESSQGIAGTGFWRAPEILLAVKDRNMRREIFTKQSDVYSFAMTCYEVITGRMPFEDQNMHDYDLVLRGERPTLPNDPPYSLYNNLVTKCWHQDPNQRPSFEEILKELHHVEVSHQLGSCILSAKTSFKDPHFQILLMNCATRN